MIRQLFNRRVPQFLALYVVGGWGFVQFVDWVVEQYLLSPTLTNLVVALLLVFLPAVIVIAWRHGAPGEDRWKATDAAAIGLNVVLAAAIAFGLFRDAELGRTAEVRLLENPEGEMVERTVATPEFRRRLQAFNFTNETGNAELGWLGRGVTLGVGGDLAQDPYVSARGPEMGYTAERLREAGLDPEDDLPLALMRDLARAQGMDYFFDGTIERTAGDSLAVRTRLYETESARAVASRSYPLDDPREAADRISVDLRRDMGIPQSHIETNPDLPVAEIVTRSREAFHAIVESESAVARADLDGAAEAARRAVEIDSTAVIGYMLMAQAARMRGDMESFRSAIGTALAYDYRLPERMRLNLQTFAQIFGEQDLDAALRTARYWAEAYPGDPDAHFVLANIHRRRGDEEARDRELAAAVAIDPSHLEVTRTLASTQRARGEYEPAIAAYRELAALQPGNISAQFALAGVLRDAGRFDDARDAYEQARTIDPRDADAPRLLGVLELHAGNRERAELLRAEAGALARTTRERERLAGFDETLCYLAGQFDCLKRAYRERLRLVSDPELNSPVGVLEEIDNSEFLRYAVEAGRDAEARAQIDSLSGTVEEPYDYSMYRSAASLAIYGRDPDAARAALSTLRERAAAIPIDTRWTRWWETWLEGHIAWWEDGNCGRALDVLEALPRLRPSHWESRLPLLQCHTELEQWDDAAATADWAMEHWPGWVPFRLEIARYHAARGERELALEHLDFVLDAWSQADPAYQPAREARALRRRLVGG